MSADHPSISTAKQVVHRKSTRRFDRPTRRALFSCALAALLLAHCGGSEVEDETTNLDALKALPYVDFSTEGPAEQTGVVSWDKEKTMDGYNLFVSFTMCRADLIDMAGNPIRTWADDDCHHWGHAILLEDGELLVQGAHALAPDDDRDTMLERSYIQRMSWDGELLWKTQLGAHHDNQLTPSGDIVTLTNSWRKVPEVSREHDTRDQGLALLTGDGQLIKDLSLYDVVARHQDILPYEENAPRGRFDTKEIDILHVNTVEWMDDPSLFEKSPIYGPDNALITSRNQNAVFIVNWKTEELLWAWGQGEILGPHGGTVLDNGRILIFDNGLGRQWSRVLEIDPLTEEILWEYKAPEPTDFYSSDRGAVQRLENGNTLITESMRGNVFEITPDNEIVWEFVNPNTNEEGVAATINRMNRYSKEFIESLPR